MGGIGAIGTDFNQSLFYRVMPKTGIGFRSFFKSIRARMFVKMFIIRFKWSVMGVAFLTGVSQEMPQRGDDIVSVHK